MQRLKISAGLLVACACFATAYAGTLDCPTVGNPCNDTTPSLGRFIIKVTDPALAAILTGASVPGWDAADKIFLSPLLSDQNTIIGRSAPFSDGSASDTNGVTVGVTGGGVTALPNQKDPSMLPAGFPSGSNNDEVHTAILNFDLQGGGLSVTAGAAMPGGSPNAGKSSPGEVESIGCAQINGGPACNDFPANSFFDVFVEVTLPGGLGSVHNDTALVVQNASIDALPPKVVYVHGTTSTVNIIADANGPGNAWLAGDTLGTFVLTGHGVQYTPADKGKFNQQFDNLAQTQTNLSPSALGFVESQLGLPEPSTWVMLWGGLGLVGAGRLRRRK